MTDATTVGELPADAIVLRVNTNNDVVHLPGADCSHLERSDTTPVRKRAAVLYRDTPICRDCRGVAYRGTGESETALPATTEVQG